MKYFRRFRSTGEPFFIDERGNIVTEAQAKTNLVENSTAESFRESAADTAAAKLLVGNFVKNRDTYGPGEIYKVASVDDKGSATLHGPIGKGGTKTISHKDLVTNHEDLGSEQALDQVKESAREKMEEAFRRTAPVPECTFHEDSPAGHRSAMEEAFLRFAPANSRGAGGERSAE